MSVRVSCNICGASSPKTIDVEPAAAWSKAHRCSISRLIEVARERRTTSRIGRSIARETDHDLVIMGELAKRLAEHETVLAACLTGLVEGKSSINFIESDRGFMRPWEEMVAAGVTDAAAVQRAIDMLATIGVHEQEEAQK